MRNKIHEIHYEDHSSWTELIKGNCLCSPLFQTKEHLEGRLKRKWVLSKIVTTGGTSLLDGPVISSLVQFIVEDPQAQVLSILNAYHPQNEEEGGVVSLDHEFLSEKGIRTFEQQVTE